MAHEIVPVQETLRERLSIAQIEDRRASILQLMKKVMRKGIDYGHIPGAPKPTLLKPGAEKLCALFQLANRIEVTNLSMEGVAAYEVKVRLYTIGTDVLCGEGVGTCSSLETKYKWRAALCKEEFDATPTERRRIAYRRQNNTVYTVAQIRTEEADHANTVLKMAVKRATVAATLSVTAVSDIFTQDIKEDLDEGEEPVPDEPGDEEEGDEEEETVPPTRKPPAPAKPTQPGAAKVPTISEPQMKRFYAIAKGSGKSDDDIKRYLRGRFNIEHSRDLRRDQYDEACLWAAGIQPKDVKAQASAPPPRNPDAEDPPPEDDEVF
jgi:hypothetical protein